FLFQSGRMDRLFEVRLHFVLVTRVGVDHVPLLVHRALFLPALRARRLGSRSDHRNKNPTTWFSTTSTRPTNNATSSTVAITTVVESRSSSRVGQLTRPLPRGRR